MAGAGLDEGLVPGRTCGTCVVCCYALPIDTAEFQKLPGETCVHCTGRSCGIYESRPDVCRGFQCGWRLLSLFDDDWRPDRSGILVTPELDGIPAEFALRQGIEFLVLGGKDSIRRRGVVEMVLLFVRRGVATFISVAGPSGHFPAKVLVNDRMQEAAAKGDREKALSLLLDLVEGAATYTFSKAELVQKSEH